MTLETSFRRFARIDNSVRRTSAFYVQTPRTVARLTANVLRVLSFCLQSCVRRSFEISRDFVVTRVAALGAYELRARDAGRRKNGLIRRAARKQNHGERGCSPDAPQNFLALTVDPSS